MIKGVKNFFLVTVVQFKEILRNTPGFDCKLFFITFQGNREVGL